MRPLPPFIRRHLLPIVLILLAGGGVYANTLHVPFIMDDHAITSIGTRPLLDTILHGTARRVADLTFAVNYRLHGTDTPGYHIVNLAIHLAAALALYLLSVSALAALRGESEPAPESGFTARFIPAAAALLFALHPLQTQAVTYIIQRYTSLATLFYLLAALLFVRARLLHDRGAPPFCRLLPAAGCLLAGLLALGSKQIAATLPLMLIVLEIALFRGRLLGHRLVPFCAAGAGIVILVLLVTRGGSLQDTAYDLHHATSEDNNTPRLAYFLTQTRVMVLYLRLLLIPRGQSVFHDIGLSTSLTPEVLPALALHVILIGTAILLLRRADRAVPRLAALGICWFYVALLVEASFFPITDLIFEHRAYLPSAGIFLSVSAVTAGLVRNRSAALILLAIACLVLGSLTVARNRTWNDRLTLWQDTVAKAPGSYLAWGNLAGVHLERNRPDLAIRAYVRAIELNPGLNYNIQSLLGVSLQRMGLFEGRFAAPTTDSTSRPAGPDYGNMPRMGATLFNNLGLAYEYLGNPVKAREAYRSAIWADPGYDLAWFNMGLLAKNGGDGGQVAIALRELQRLGSPWVERLQLPHAQRP